MACYNPGKSMRLSTTTVAGLAGLWRVYGGFGGFVSSGPPGRMCTLQQTLIFKCLQLAKCRTIRHTRKLLNLRIIDAAYLRNILHNQNLTIRESQGLQALLRIRIFAKSNRKSVIGRRKVGLR